MIVPRHYEDPHVLHENTLPNRAYFIPCSQRNDRLVHDRASSDRMILLSGTWQFRYYDSVRRVREAFYEPDFDASEYGTIPVPGNWQCFGFDRHQYTNVRYPIPFDPPYVPQDDPCGCYIRSFDYQPDEKTPFVTLNFEGVDSCFYCWLNGHYLGYSQVSHSTSEFLVSPWLKKGENKLAVLVLKWCDGTYLEDQDKFRMSGIFRDVYLLRRPEKHLEDYFVTTSIGENSALIRVGMKPYGGSLPVDVKLYDRDGRVAASAQGMPADDADYPMAAELTVTDPELWNAEAPYLYTLVLSCGDETITDRVGIRSVTVKNNTVLLNGRKIKFRGVNRHDSDPVNGYAVTLDQIMKDLALMKAHNFNAIRCSHYPNSPVFTQLCDEYGFYVIDEADHEAHGTIDLYYGKADRKDVLNKCSRYLEDNPEYVEAVVDRVQRCVTRDKNRPCVLIWSMGNEAFYGCATEAALKWTKGFDPSRLTHYEGAYNAGSYRAFDFSCMDLYSRMYPSLKEIEDYLASSPARPIIMCEYCHAMGNGPGDLEDYRELIEKNDAFCGGFIWEWCDHAIYKGRADNGKPIYFYGGDHGENRHDGNFCMDGLVFPDRTPHTGLKEAWNVYRPARVTGFDQSTGALTLHNETAFTDLKDMLNVEWEVTRDGLGIASGNMLGEDMPSVGPGEFGRILLGPLPEALTGKCYLKVTFRQKTDGPLTPAGHCLGFDEVLLNDERTAFAGRLLAADEEAASRPALSVREDDDIIAVTGSGFTVEFDRATGLIHDIVREGRSLLCRPVQVNLWRAPTDNDRNIRHIWQQARYDQTVVRAYDTQWAPGPDGVTVSARMSVSSDSIQRIADIAAVWTIGTDGRIRIDMDVRKDPVFPDLPRFGLRFFLPKCFDQLSYYGMGPQESYCDKHRASSHGLYTGPVKDQHTDYLKPQENGSHYDSDWVLLTDGNERFAVTSGRPFSFNASVYSQEELTKKRHAFELEESPCTILCADYKLNGIGSNSCGPDLLDQYRFSETAFRFSLTVAP
ncbi:MAG: DUF4981 domain-containing protein [Clostridia bacterium]|nr:DUF4981 domain-containing protein [Clostridia bacterium]